MQEPTARAPRPSVSAWTRSLLARFDGAVLRVAPPRASASTSVTGLAALQAWCFAGALPRVEQRFTVATLAEAGLAHEIDAFSRHLDGTDQLAAAGGRWAGLWLRLRVKLNDALAWRARRPSDPWDAGYLIGDAQAWQRFQPRRATLMVADGHLSDAALREAVRILQSNSAGYRHPVRLLVVGRSIDALAWSSTPSSSLAIREIAWPSDAAARVSVASASTASASR
ncbi:hypothetical protein [Hydrogenophaga sp. 2FB]|uniref:hypothetical protein n=1 Tax=Hydrogenophaga sp. 2FB TaxID=2502187 RepID=UPI0010F5D832|nr:hypothetical protein [Hydrogenophaga sp. 2FB]